jgi:hypothetical protein
MVSRDSAIYPLSENCNEIAIQDHSKMVKFRSRADPHYQRVFAKIEEMMENHDREAKLSDSSFTPMETTTPKALFWSHSRRMMITPENLRFASSSMAR